MEDVIYNRSKTYLFPLLDHVLPFNNFVYEIMNVYTNISSFEDVKRKIIVEINTETEEKRNSFITYLKCHESDLFVSCIDDNVSFTTLLFKFPEKFKQEFDLFKYGKYSKFRKPAKMIILEKSFTYYKYPEIVNGIRGVLFKTDDMKHKLEEYLGLKLPIDSEFTSKPNVLEETFKPKEYA